MFVQCSIFNHNWKIFSEMISYKEYTKFVRNCTKCIFVLAKLKEKYVEVEIDFFASVSAVQRFIIFIISIVFIIFIIFTIIFIIFCIIFIIFIIFLYFHIVISINTKLIKVKRGKSLLLHYIVMSKNVEERWWNAKETAPLLYFRKKKTRENCNHLYS